MHVTLAAKHRQPRRPVACDNCVGQTLMDPPETPLVSITPSVSVRSYNVLLPGMGTHTFDLHQRCADSLR